MPYGAKRCRPGGTDGFTLIVRSYQGENVRSRPISETKHLWANSVLTWGTSWESLVLNVFPILIWLCQAGNSVGLSLLPRCVF